MAWFRARLTWPMGSILPRDVYHVDFAPHISLASSPVFIHNIPPLSLNTSSSRFALQKHQFTIKKRQTYLRLLQISLLQDLDHDFIFGMGPKFAFEGLLRRGVVGVLSAVSVVTGRVVISQKDLQGMLQGGKGDESSQRVIQRGRY